MPTEPVISIVIPLYNERDNVPLLAERILPVFEEFALPAECIFVDDGSADGTREAIELVSKSDPRFRAIRLARNFGQSAALLTGMQRARGKFIVTLDGDLQNDPQDLPGIVKLLEEYDCVCGYRSVRHDSWLRRLTSRAGNWLRNTCVRDGLRDGGCGTKGFRRECLQYLVPFNGAHRFFGAMLRNAGMRIVETPVRHHAREFGVSKYGVRNRLFRLIFDLVGVAWLQRRLVFPQVEGES